MPLWFIQRSGQEEGPLTSKQLKERADSGDLLPTHFVRTAESETWVQAARVRGLFPQATTPGVSEGPPSAVPPTTPMARSGISSEAAKPSLPSEDAQRTPDVLETRYKRLQEITGAFHTLLTDLNKLDHGSSWRLRINRIAQEIAERQENLDRIAAARHDLLARMDEHKTLTGQQTEARLALTPVEKKLSGHAAALGEAIYSEFQANTLPITAVDDETCRLIQGCLEVTRQIDALRRQSEEAAHVSGMLAKVKAKAEQLVIWGKIQSKEVDLNEATKRLGQSILDRSVERRFDTPVIKPLLQEIGTIRSEIATKRNSLQAAESRLSDPRYEGVEQFGQRVGQSSQDLDRLAIEQVIRYGVLADVCRSLCSDQRMESLDRFSKMQKLLDESDLDCQKTNLPDWITYKFDQIENKHVWIGKLGADASVEFSLHRNLGDSGEKLFLVVTHSTIGGGVKVGAVPGSIGTRATILGIHQGESLKIRSGGRLLVFRTAGRSRIQRSAVNLAVVQTDSITEEQSYHCSAEAIRALSDGGPEILFRLQGGKEVEGKLGEQAIARLREWVVRMRIERAVAVAEFRPQLAQERAETRSIRKPSPVGVPSPVNDGEAQPQAGLVTGAIGAAAGLAVGFAGHALLTGKASASESLGVSDPQLATGMMALDTNADGQVDAVLADSDGDGRVDGIVADLNHDGLVDAIGVDRDGDGELDVVAVDSDHDGRMEGIGMDRDGDGALDTFGVDIDEDGDLDAVGYDYDEDGTLDAIDEDGDFDAGDGLSDWT